MCLVQIILQTELLVRLLYHILQKTFSTTFVTMFLLEEFTVNFIQRYLDAFAPPLTMPVFFGCRIQDLQAFAQLQNQQSRTVCSYPSPWILSIKSNTESHDEL